jgi:Clp amino terminal domain, pathogenicity island component
LSAQGRRDELVFGRLPRSRASDRVLRQAVELAFQRGERGPSDEHVLLALADDDRIRPVLHELGLDDEGGAGSDSSAAAPGPDAEQKVGWLAADGEGTLVGTEGEDVEQTLVGAAGQGHRGHCVPRLKGDVGGEDLRPDLL